MAAVAPREALPFGQLPAEMSAGRPFDVTFAVHPPHPSNQMHVERVSNDRLQSPLRAAPVGSDAATGRQVFQARLPSLAPGETVEYTPVLTRSGLVIERLPARATRGVAQVAAPIEPSPATQDARGAARYEWASEFLGAFTVQLAKPPESFGPVSDGLHITFYVASGEIHGPRINAKIRGEGGDWMLVRRDGVGVADVRITYETDDGALLLSRYYGIFDLGPSGYERALRNEYDPVPPLVLAPQFVTSHPNWLWLNRLQCVAVGRVTMADLIVRFDLYAIRAGQPLPSSGLPRVAGEPLIGDLHQHGMAKQPTPSTIQTGAATWRTTTRR
jgi:Protein of unknown function (DUF3237)